LKKLAVVIRADISWGYQS